MAAEKSVKKCEFVADPEERMKKWKTWSDSLMKRAKELSILCDTPTCVVISPPTNEDDTPMINSCSKFGLWPDDRDNNGASVQRMIDLYKKKQLAKIHNNTSSSSNPKVKAREKVKVSNNSDNVNVGVSCGGGDVELRRQVEGAKIAMEDVNARMDQIKIRIDQINNDRKRKISQLDSVADHDEHHGQR